LGDELHVNNPKRKDASQHSKIGVEHLSKVATLLAGIA
jgi:hypothetical protein